MENEFPIVFCKLRDFKKPKKEKKRDGKNKLKGGCLWTNETSAHRRINEPNKMLNLRGFFNQLSNKEIILYKQKLTAFQKISGFIYFKCDFRFYSICSIIIIYIIF